MTLLRPFLSFKRAWAVSFPTGRLDHRPRARILRKLCAATSRQDGYGYFLCRKVLVRDFCHLADRQDRGFFVPSRI